MEGRVFLLRGVCSKGNADVSPPAFVLFGLSYACICVFFFFYPLTRLRFVWTLVSRANPETSAARGDALVSKSDGLEDDMRVVVYGVVRNQRR